ncbi:unnamed protein product [Clavelina lepadiformis]|uniref:Uncharacterized protein n=1 Tax=Clavelina lepadiformis TaxID=159417 RepID=A0ABP0EZM4_CLALP
MKETKAQIHVSPQPSMFDEKVNISVEGLLPNRTYTIHSYTNVSKASAFECFAHYRSNKHGVVSIKDDSSLGGSYRGVEPMGLFWAMDRSPDNTNPHARMAERNASKPTIVDLHVYDLILHSLEEISRLRKQGILQKHAVSSKQVERRYLAEGVRKMSLTLEEDGIWASLFIPPGKGPFPGVIHLGGGRPGLVENQAALLSRYGFATMALASFDKTPGKFTHYSDKGFGLDYFERALKVFTSNPDVDSACGVGVVSFSFTTAIGLSMAQHLDQVKCVIWINGQTHATYCPLIFKEVTLPSIPPNFKKSKFSKEGFASARYAHNLCNDPLHESIASSLIKFHLKPKVGYLFVTSLDDKASPSELNVNRAETLLKEVNHPNYEILRLPGAGHVIMAPYSPITITLDQGNFNIKMVQGGEKVAHCRAQESAWHCQIEFLKANLDPCMEKAKL